MLMGSVWVESQKMGRLGQSGEYQKLRLQKEEETEKEGPCGGCWEAGEAEAELWLGGLQRG